jgi:hypothetical protein
MRIKTQRIKVGHLQTALLFVNSAVVAFVNLQAGIKVCLQRGMRLSMWTYVHETFSVYPYAGISTSMIKFFRVPILKNFLVAESRLEVIV